MAQNEKGNTPSKHNEELVRSYFNVRPGWEVAKLDTGKQQAADFRVCYGSGCFLAEVKTIASVHANYPYTPLIAHSEQRQKHQAEIKKWLSEHPGQHIILPESDWEYIRGDEIKFDNRYRHIGRHAEDAFEQFKETMQSHFETSSVQSFPYQVRLDSNNLYVPNSAEREKFFAWLESEIQQIHAGKPGKCWHADPIPGTNITRYSTFYPIRKPTHENDPKADYQINIEGPFNQKSLDLNIFSYGGLNLDAVNSNLEKAASQLRSSAERESDAQAPRVVVLAFDGSLSFEWGELIPYLGWFLEQHPDLSAIAVLDRIPTDIPTLPENDFSAWSAAVQTATWKDRFVVFHNQKLQLVKPLPRSVFEDHLSVQFPPLTP